MAKIETIEGVGPAAAKKFQKAGVRTCEKLLVEGATKKGRSALAKASGVDEKKVLAFVNCADLMRIKGVGSEFSELLERAGVDTVKELKHRRPDNLTAKMVEVNAASIKKSKKSIVRRVPSEKEVIKWVAQAKTLPAVVKY
jgi:predicted flap endonuclease-1-like 5' DNA nuclease